jgi:hypothetical protein
VTPSGSADAAESKVGYTTMTGTIPAQVAKDPVAAAEWAG